MRYLRRHQNLNHKDMEVDAGRSQGGAGADRVESLSVSPVFPTFPVPPPHSELVPLAQTVHFGRPNSERSRDHVNNLSLFAAVASSTPPQVDGAGECTLFLESELPSVDAVSVYRSFRIRLVRIRLSIMLL
jgi:hypothetical protein